MHILKGNLNAKEDISLRPHGNTGDVDDLIFEDSWLISDR